MERARRTLLALRVRDRCARLPALGERRRGRLPGRLRADVRTARLAPRRRRDQAMARAAHAECLRRPAARRRARAADGGARRRRGGRGDRASRRGARPSTRGCALSRRTAARSSTASSPATRATASIGEALELPAGTIASRISRCLGKLREKLEGRNPVPDPSGDSVSAMPHIDEVRLGELLGVLPPAPVGWVQAAQELPEARRQLDEIVELARADAAFPGSTRWRTSRPRSRRRDTSRVPRSRKRCARACRARFGVGF